MEYNYRYLDTKIVLNCELCEEVGLNEISIGWNGALFALYNTDVREIDFNQMFSNYIEYD